MAHRAHLEELVTTTANQENPAPVCQAAHDIAIVGMSCRMPGSVTNPDQAWQLLLDGVDAISETPANRFPIAEWVSTNRRARGKGYSRWGGYLDDVDAFDCGFFGISPNEAAAMDPQQRITLELAWEALENAGIVPASLAGSRTDVLMGVSNMEYARFSELSPMSLGPYSGTGAALSIVANRVSYVLDLRGLSMVIDTACSSSLTAIALACQRLRSGAADVALAGGVSLVLGPSLMVSFSKAGALSADGRCKAFSDDADGFVRSEGAGVVVLRRLEDALADSQQVLAIIEGVGSVQDGKTQGLMAPNQEAQVSVIRQACADAGISPDDLAYVEAHGTGTSIGDAIELRALARATAGRAQDSPTLIGSLKSNIGHTEPAAGVLSLVKAVLALQHRVLPPSLHVRRPNPVIEQESLNVRVVTEATDLPGDAEQLHVGVSAFGFGGMNAHVVMRPAPPRAISVPSGSPLNRLILPLSAQSRESLAARAEQFAEMLEQCPDPAALCSEAAVHSTHHAHRLVVQANDRAELAEALRSDEAEARWVVAGRRRLRQSAPTVFVFSGQGGRWWPLAEDHRDLPEFRATLQRCGEVLRRLAGLDLTGLLACPQDSDLLHDPALGQPVLTCLQIALAAQWAAWGVVPDLVVGHSLGEVAAFQVAGSLTLEDAVRVALQRGRSIAEHAAPGLMALVKASADDVRERIGQQTGAVWVAAENSATDTIIAGDTEAVRALVDDYTARECFARPLRAVSYASHGPGMAAAAADLESALAGLHARPPHVEVVSTLTGERYEHAPIASYWADNLTHPVLFSRALQATVTSGGGAYVELGPHTSLGVSVADVLEAAGVGSRSVVVSSLRRDEPAVNAMVGQLAVLHCAGHEVAWPAVTGTNEVRSGLPSYPWHRSRHWLPREQTGSRSGHPVLGSCPVSLAEGGSQLWSGRVDVATFGWLADHCVEQATVLPATFLAETMLSAAWQVAGECCLTDVRFHQPMLVTENASADNIQVTWHEREGLEVYGREVGERAGSWTRIASARLGDAPARATGRPKIVTWEAEAGEVLNPKELYATLRERGLVYGTSFRVLDSVTVSGGKALGSLEPRGETDPDAAFLAHPALLDGACQLAAALLAERGDTRLRIPSSYQRMWVEASPARAEAILVSDGTDESYRIALLDQAGGLVGEIVGLQLAELRAAPPDETNWLLQQVWSPFRGLAPDGTWAVIGEGEVAEQLRLALVACGCRIGTADQAGLAGILDCTSSAPHVPASGGRDSEGPASEVAGDDRSGWDGAAQDQQQGLDSLVSGSWLPLAARLCGAAEQGVGNYVLVTLGARSIAGETVDPVAASVWGLGCVARAELGLNVVMADLGAPADAEALVACLGRAGSGGRDAQLAVRGGRVLAGHLDHCSSEVVPTQWNESVSGAAVLVGNEHGDLASLRLQQAAIAPPRPGEVEIAVEAAGLNFSDVLKAMGRYPGVCGQEPLGGECCGVVTAIGEGVTRAAVGDRVIAIAPRSMATTALTDERLVARIGTGVSAAHAAAAPIVELTARMALDLLGRVREGDWVLVHSATGGLGQAALRLARARGCKIVASAGSSAKRQELAEQGLELVIDSRGGGFAPLVDQATHGHGLDVILNTLSGQGLVEGLRSLAPGGRFIELGKADLYGSSRMDMGLLAQNRCFLSFDLHELVQRDPAAVTAWLDLVARDVDSGFARPAQLTTFSLEHAEEAFLLMGSFQHRGKLVLTRPQAPVDVWPDPDWPCVRPGRTYLVTGGTGALGTHLAQQLVTWGASDVVLVSRRAQCTEPAIEALVEAGVVRHIAADVCDRAAMDAVLAACPRLAGVFHLAGVLSDAALGQLDPAVCSRVAAPKMTGLDVLDRATRAVELDHFVVFSSAAARLGSPGQASYAAANAYASAVVERRRAVGLPGVSIEFGPWEASMADADGRDLRLVLVSGLTPITPAQGMKALALALRPDAPAIQVALSLDLDSARRARQQGLSPDALAALLDDESQDTTAGPALVQELRRTAPALRRERLLEICRITAGGVLRVPPADLDTSVPFNGLGFDSLMGLELCKRLESQLGVAVPPTVVWRHPTLDLLGEHLLDVLGLGAPSDPAEDELEPSLQADPAREPEVDQVRGPQAGPEAVSTADSSDTVARLAAKLAMLEGNAHA